jgi:hypothetical protein
MPISGKFLGQTKGNRTNPINVSESALGSGESHSGSPSSKFIGKTKGNTTLPINRTEGVSGGHGGKQGPR